MNEDAVWEALTRALSGEYDIVARLGLGRGGAPVYLARELVTDNFVALRLPPLVSGNESQEYGLEIVRQIDASLPEIETQCSNCGATLRHWARFCSRCGRDISGLAPNATDHPRDRLQTLARNTAAGKYEMLGEMTRAEGGGLVYFGRDFITGRIVGLQLESGPNGTLSLTTTQFDAPDPSIQIPESRHASGDQLARRVSVPRGPDRSATIQTRQTPERASRTGAGSGQSTDARTRMLTTAVVVLLLIMVAMMTCQVL